MEIQEGINTNLYRQAQAVFRSQQFVVDKGIHDCETAGPLLKYMFPHCVITGSGKHKDKLQKIVSMGRDIYKAVKLFNLNVTIRLNKILLAESFLAVLGNKLLPYFLAFLFKSRTVDNFQRQKVAFGIAS